jgi:hypothetical protein
VDSDGGSSGSKKGKSMSDSSISVSVEKIGVKLGMKIERFGDLRGIWLFGGVRRPHEAITGRKNDKNNHLPSPKEENGMEKYFCTYALLK